MSFVSVPWFFATWLTLELPLHHLVLSIALCALAVLSKAPFWVIGVAMLAGAIHFGHFFFADRTADILVNSLDGFLSRERREALSSALKGLRRTFHVWPVAMMTPKAVRVARDIAYGPFKKRNFLDVYSAKENAGDAPHPVLLQIHGGGWTVGHKRQQGRPLMHALASRGWVCVAINYRLSPWAKFPDHIVDVKRAIAWVKANIHRFGGDPARIVITGGSAGAHLSALAALSGNEPIFQPGFEEEDTSVAACVPFYGVYDFLDRHNDRQDLSLRMFLRTVMGSSRESSRDAWDRASPLSWIHPNAPPFFVIHGRDDCLAWIEEGRRFVEELRKVSKNPVLFAELPNAQHAFDVVHSARTDLTVEAVSAFVNEVADAAMPQAPAKMKERRRVLRPSAERPAPPLLRKDNSHNKQG